MQESILFQHQYLKKALSAWRRVTHLCHDQLIVGWSGGNWKEMDGGIPSSL